MKTATRILFAFTMLMIASVNLKASTYYWVGGSGVWSDYANHWATSSGGTTFQTSIPTITDDIIFDSNSFTALGQDVVFDNTFYYCKSMNWTGVQFAPAFRGAGGILNVAGSFVLASSVTVEQMGLTLLANTSGNLIHTFGQTFSYVQIDGTGDYTLQSEFNAQGDININSGSLDANGFDISCNSLYLANTATLISGDIQITITGTLFSFNPRRLNALGNMPTANQTNVLFDCTSGEIDGTNTTNAFDSVIFIGAGSIKYITINYCTVAEDAFCDEGDIHKATFQSNAFLFTSTFDSLICSDLRIYDNTTITINNKLIVNADCNHFGNIYSYSATIGGVCTISCPSGTIDVNYTNIHGVIATGGATFIANNSIDLGNNTGWTINTIASRDLYWIGGEGNWNDPNHWSLTSGGAAVLCVPSPLDNVYFDSNSLSGNDSVFLVDDNVFVKNFNVNTIPSTCTFFGTRLTVEGDFIVTDSLNWRVTTVFLKASVNSAIECASDLYYLEILSTATYTLTGELRMLQLFLEGGHLDISNENVYALAMSGYPMTTMSMTNSHLYMKEYFIDGSTPGSTTATLTMDAENSRIYRAADFDRVEFLYSGTVDSNLTANYFTNFGTVTLGNHNTIRSFSAYGNLIVIGDNSVDTLYLDSDCHSYLQDPGKTMTINNVFNVNVGSCSNFIEIKCSNAGQQTNFFQSNGNAVYLYHVDLQGINASGANFVADQSINSGGNTGIAINSPTPRTLYWIGGGGLWQDTMHWSLSSGGPNISCTPSAVDDVIFDANSGVAGQTLYSLYEKVSVNSLTMNGAGSNITFELGTLSVNTSLLLEPAMNFNVDNLILRGTSNSTLNTSGNTLREILINGTNTISLGSSLTATALDIISGSFDMNGNDLQASSITSSVGTTFTAGSVTIITTNFDLLGTVLNTVNTDIEMRFFAPGFGTYGTDFSTPGQFRTIDVYSNASFSARPFSCQTMNAYSYVGLNSSFIQDSIGKLTVYNDAAIFGNWHFDTLFANSPGHILYMQGQIAISSEFLSNGTAGFPVSMRGQQTVTITKSGGDVCLHNTFLQDIVTAGTSNFYAGQGCSDLGGNTGWQFTTCNTTSDVWPGDANYDLICNNVDILNIGVAFNEIGPVRAGANTSWTAQPAADFTNYFATAINMKHADCDGNGVVEYADTTAINQNYSLTHPARFANPNVSTNAVLPPLMLDATPDTVGPMMAVQVDVLLGTSLLPVDSLYGIAFSINYDPTVVDTNSVQEDFTGSWLGTQGVDMITFVRHFPTIGKIDVAMVRNDQQNILNGFGHLALFDVVIVDNISTVTNSLFRLTDVSAITYTQYIQSVARVNDTIIVDPLFNKVAEIDLSSHFSVYPNPATSVLNVHTTDIKVETIEIFDVTGKLMVQNKSHSNQIAIPVEGLSQGIYQVRFISDKGIYNKAIEIVTR